MAQPDSSRARAKSIGHYILGKTIGEGTFGKVKLGTHILTSERVAVKILEKERIVEVADVERVAREVHILKLIRHPHIVQLYEIIETRRQLYLIMEYASGGELFDYIVARGRVPEPEACRFFHQIIAGLEKVHAMNIVHRDLKPENLLLDEHNNIKIVDFGLSNVFRQGQLLKTACGSPCYAAPEMIAGHSYVPHLCDLWSCGVILFAMVCGYLPFEDQNTSALYKKILSADYKTPKFISESVRDLIARLLTTDPSRRFQVPDVRAHAWYRQIPEASTPVPEGTPGQGEKQDMKLEEDVLTDLDAFGFPREYAVRCLQLNKHNHVTTTYYLLNEKKRRLMERLQRIPGADYVSAMFDCDIPIPPGGDAAAGTGSACSDHISIVANQPGSPSTAAPPATAPAPTPPKVRRCASPPSAQAQASKPTPTPRTSARTPCNPRVGGPAAAMASPASPRTASGGYPSSARTGTRPARAPASPPASSSKMESSPPSARRATPGTSSSSSGHNHAAVAAAVANKVAAATQAGSKPSVRPASAASAKVSPNMSARTTMTRPGSLAKSSNSGSLMHRILAKDPSPPVRRTTPTTAPHVPHTSSPPATVRSSGTGASPRDLTRSTESARRRAAATTGPSSHSVPHSVPHSASHPAAHPVVHTAHTAHTAHPSSARTRLGVRPPVHTVAATAARRTVR